MIMKSRFFEENYPGTAVEQLRVGFNQVITWMSIAIGASGFVTQLIVGATAGQINIAAMATTAAFTILAFFAMWLNRQGYSRASSTFILTTFILSYLFVQQLEILLLVGVFALVGSALFSPLWLFIVTNLVVIGKLIVLFLEVIAETGMQVTDAGTDLVIRISSLILISVTLRFFIATAEGAAQKAQRSSDLLRGASEISQITSKLLDLDQLFERAIELIRDRFAFYHVQIFVVDDDREFAVLRASTGAAGQQLIEKGHKLMIGSQSVIGQVTQKGEPVIARDTDTNVVHARNELLPSTRSELALPIFDGERIIGALDVQSTRVNAFFPTDIQALQVMANQLGVAIRNARLFEALNRNLEENKRLLLERESSLRENQRLTRQLTENIWQDYLAENQNVSGITLVDNQIVADAQWTPAMLDATRRQRPSRNLTPEGKQIVAVPIILRGQPIGALEVQTSTPLNEDETVDLVQAVAQRLAVSLDNARLFEEAQKTAVQEQRINEIAALYQAAATVDDLLQITLEELTESLGAKGSMIRLAVANTDDAGNGVAHNGYHPNGGRHD